VTTSTVAETAHTDDGLAIAYRAVGEGTDGVLFLHGWAGSGAYFDDTIGHLDPARTRSVTFDLRGHGESSKEADDFSLDRIAADAVAVMDAAGLDNAVLVGFSMAGKFALYLACSAPERVRGQILVAGSPADQIPLPQEMLDDWYSRAGSAERIVELVRGFIKEPVAQETLERFGRDAALIPRQALEGTLTACISTSFVDRLGSIRAPTLVVGGMHDPMFTPDVLRGGMVDPVPGARLALLDCSHEVPIERPLELAAVIESFIAGLGSNGADSARR
jgi:pimeloyl-ACP methyl ester carboxylesterase